MSATWCQTENIIQVNGTLGKVFFGTSATGEPVDVKIFERGEDNPIGNLRTGVTNNQGEFTVEFPVSEISSSTSYLVNTLYRDHFLQVERISIEDFDVQNPPENCTN